MTMKGDCLRKMLCKSGIVDVKASTVRYQRQQIPFNPVPTAEKQHCRRQPRNIAEGQLSVESGYDGTFRHRQPIDSSLKSARTRIGSSQMNCSRFGYVS